MNPFSKKDMSEEDIKRRYITPAIEAKWDAESITMETQITDGQYNLKGNIVNRGSAKRADYLLYINANNPIAVVEAKDNKKGSCRSQRQQKGNFLRLAAGDGVCQNAGRTLCVQL